MEILRRSGEYGTFGPPGIAALSAGGLRGLQLPSYVRRVVIAADNDANETGQSAATALRYRLWSEGKLVSLIVPPKVDTDWNDVLVGGQELSNVVRLRP
jgi:putative DNA primase/helicase